MKQSERTPEEKDLDYIQRYGTEEQRQLVAVFLKSLRQMIAQQRRAGKRGKP